MFIRNSIITLVFLVSSNLVLGCNSINRNSSVYQKDIVDLDKYFVLSSDASENRKALNDLINQYISVKLPNFEIVIDDVGIDIPSNAQIYFQEKTKLKLKPSQRNSYQLFRIHNKENISLFSPNLIGDFKNHLGKTGEWGMGISIIDSKDIYISNACISEMWGDGIYLGSSNKGNNHNVKIVNSKFEENRRNGLSLISGENIRVSDVKVIRNGGTLPSAGIDIEPNFPTDVLKKIVFTNIVSEDNLGAGILISLTKFTSSEFSNFVEIEVNSLTDTGSKYPFMFDGGFHKNHMKLKGEINFNVVDARKNEFIYRDIGTLSLLPENTSLNYLNFSVEKPRVQKLKNFYLKQGIKVN
ncbi:right-handed parallel beta-helix repeat-containing protein [Myroides odoratus]